MTEMNEAPLAGPRVVTLALAMGVIWAALILGVCAYRKGRR